MLQRIIPIIFLLITASCVKDVDFEQAENLAISPVLESSLIFFNFSAPEFQEPTGTALVIEQDELELDFFNEEFIRDNLVKAEFFFEVTSSIDRTFHIEISMFDMAGNATNTFDISITSDGNNETQVIHRELFEGATLDQLKNTTQMKVILTMFPHDSGIPLDDTSTGNLKMRSKATLFFEIDTK